MSQYKNNLEKLLFILLIFTTWARCFQFKFLQE